ncbi:MAG TPA: UDP-3-O-(3-hydroxymyristoyl)glucosamine N-acyltransferase [Verrucomicrobiae bacterium]|jgi:UDP-3-O-[3-hydroxymyristoyl] glucosamine N-acyltransferase|nr:UDP-3-O-(3-hydroxymyristoyl)glucosamine N-acyltransferase [Verrucomicrobiae bacterium]
MTSTVGELAHFVGGTVIGDPHIRIEGITNSETPRKAYITFAQTPVLAQKLESSEIDCLIVPRSVTTSAKTLIQVDEPKLAWARLLEKFFPPRTYPGTVSEQAFVSPSAQIGKGVTVEPFAYIGDHAVIGDNVVIRAQCYVDRNCQVGAGTVLHSGVKLYHDTVLGKNVVIHASSVIGADGFGYVSTMQGQQKIPQVGNVVLEDNVEIGACATIDRATIGSTRIGEGSKIDNMVQVGHNVSIGKHTVISAQTGISGSTKIGNHVTVGGKAGFGDHVEIGDWTMVGAGSGFPSGKKVPAKQVFFGEPARPYAEARRQIAAQLRSAEMLEEIKALRKRLEELENKSAQDAKA